MSPEAFSALFAQIGSYFGGTSATTAATSTATIAAESAALAQAGSTAATVTAAGQGAIAAQSGMSWGTILQGISAGSSLLQGVSGMQAGEANAAYLSDASKQALRAGAANKSIAEQRHRAQLGEFKAQMGAQGTTMSGSPMLVYLDSVKNAAIDAVNEYYTGAVQAGSHRAQSKISKMGGYADLFKGVVGAGSSLLLR